MPAPDLSAFDLPAKFRPDAELLAGLIAEIGLDDAARGAITADAAALVRQIRGGGKPALMEQFLAEYGLSSREGVALMCLAEAMLRVPDAQTVDALIEDKIAPSDWGRHLGEASSSLVNASTWALMLTGRVLGPGQPGVAGTLRGLVRRLGEPVIRAAVGRAMKEMGRQFVLGQTIGAALERAAVQEAAGYCYSYDMLGEAAMTAGEAARYAAAYADAIASIATRCTRGSVRDNPGISIKLSALHPRYEVAQQARVMAELVPVVRRLARAAAAAGMGLNIDAEEQDRLVLSLQVIAAVLDDPALAGWEGFGVVVQAYGKRAGPVIDWLHATATRLDRRIMVRLVKGAYWDTEIKQAQAGGMPGFPVFETKAATDVSYLALARRLLGRADRIYPQFATHNAHSVAAILQMAGGVPFEFQRLHGMGERLHEIVRARTGGRCRIYAPVGAHRDLLAYLVRRLLENGANSSFVHQIVDPSIPPEEVARDPVQAVQTARPPAALLAPGALFGADRQNSQGADLTDAATVAGMEALAQAHVADAQGLTLRPLTGAPQVLHDPATGARNGTVLHADAASVGRAIDDARVWAEPAAARAQVLRRAADLFEASQPAILALLVQEAGKTLPDAVGELREAVDFLRYYAAEGAGAAAAPRGIIAAISPWNFPLAIFAGQVAAALMAGNAVIAKPAEATPRIAALAVGLLHRAGVPPAALQLVTGSGAVAGAALTADARIAGVVFTGSTTTARGIARSMARHLPPGTPLIAETGGLNAMVVDSTALPAQAVRDIVASAFRSAGQRCSALRCLYLQEDIAPQMIDMICGAMEELAVGTPRHLATDIGPLIDARAQAGIAAYLQARADRILHRIAAPAQGWFIGPALLQVTGIADIPHEVFGPVLHVATFRGDGLAQVIADINAAGYGLTFGLHSRIDARVEQVAQAVRAGNVYVNRNQIGAVVGSQPFGGEGLSGTGPKAGGPHYLPRLAAPAPAPVAGAPWAGPAGLPRLQAALAQTAPLRMAESFLPGPSGELNRLTLLRRAPLLCLGPGPAAAQAQADAVTRLGGQAVCADGAVTPDAVAALHGFSAVLWWGDDETGRALAQALAGREGPILPLIAALPDLAHVAHERHLCVDTTAAGGNAALMAG